MQEKMEAAVVKAKTSSRFQKIERDGGGGEMQEPNVENVLRKKKTPSPLWTQLWVIHGGLSEEGKHIRTKHNVQFVAALSGSLKKAMTFGGALRMTWSASAAAQGGHREVVFHKNRVLDIPVWARDVVEAVQKVVKLVTQERVQRLSVEHVAVLQIRE